MPRVFIPLDSGRKTPIQDPCPWLKEDRGTTLPSRPICEPDGSKQPTNVPPLSICELASTIATPPTTIYTTPEKCAGCRRCAKPQDVNEITLALANVDRNIEEGPGTTLKKAIQWFIPQPANCGCSDRVALMNAWGKERCREEKKTILGWLRESALEYRYPYSEKAIAIVLDMILKGK